MPDDLTVHADLGGYLIGRLDPDERERYESHLASCAACRAELAELEPVARLAEQRSPPFTVPAGLEAATFAAIERAVDGERAAGAPAARPVPRWRRRPRFALLAAAGAAVALGVGVVVGLQLGGSEGPGGPTEVQAVLTAPGGSAEQAAATVTKLGIGREIELRTDDLPILPVGQFYELWFVGPGDRPDRPNRISAGTFHPDEDGRSDVRLTAAVDPAKFPELSVTRERGGDPAAGPEVLRSTAPR